MMSNQSARWAWHVGREQREVTRWTTGVRADKICPFREGTPHRICWYAGWRGKALPVWPDAI